MLTVPHAEPTPLPPPPFAPVPLWHAFPSEEREDAANDDDDDDASESESEDRRDSHRSAVRGGDEWNEPSHELEVTAMRERWRDDGDDSDDFEPTTIFDRM
jgi:hypothetical protein